MEVRETAPFNLPRSLHKITTDTALDQIIKSYNSDDPDPFLEAFFEARQKRDKNRHHWHYNEVSLNRNLQDIGFRETYRCEYSQGQCPDLDELDFRPHMSLHLEAVK